MKRNMLTQQRFTIQKVEASDIEIAWYESMSNVSVHGIKSEDIKRYAKPTLRWESP